MGGMGKEMDMLVRQIAMTLRGKGGVPWVKIMENELECLGDRTGHDGHLTKKVFEKILFLA